MITAENITKSYGAVTLFNEVSFTINPGERVGLVGRNGHGKTTLFRIIIGEEHPDSGSIGVPRHYRIGHVSQQLIFSAATVVDEGCLGLPEEHRDERWQAGKILTGLGFSADDMKKRPDELSGGYQVRLNLAKVLLSAPDMLLLDEPTNYLDITSIRWLSRFLNSWKGELMLITHDRGFMDGVVTHTMGIHRAKVRKIAGTTDKLYEQILKEEEIHEKTRMNDEKKRRETEEFIRRFRAKARLAGLVQSRVKQLEKHDRLDRLEKIKTLEFSFAEAPFPGKYLMNIEDISFSYGEGLPILIDGLSLAVGKNERICVIGRNGKGKTTLLRVLAGELLPRAGEISSHPNGKTGYYAQSNTELLRPRLTVEEEMLSSCPDGDRQRARNVCGAMMFEGDDALKPVSVLSGGEKSRVLLGKLLLAPANLLILDEPTNHLDMESCDALLSAVDNFDGAVVMVTHNEMFLHALATRIIAFQGGRVRVHEGSYRSFLEKVGWEDEEEEADRRRETGDDAVVNKKGLRRIRSEIITRRSRALKPIESRMEEIERSIVEMEKELGENHERLIRASGAGDGALITRLSKEAHGIRVKVDSLYDELDGLTRKHEEESAAFESELSAVGSEAGDRETV